MAIVTYTKYGDGMFGAQWYATVDGVQLTPGHFTKLGARIAACRYQRSRKRS